MMFAPGFGNLLYCLIFKIAASAHLHLGEIQQPRVEILKSSDAQDWMSDILILGG